HLKFFLLIGGQLQPSLESRRHELARLRRAVAGLRLLELLLLLLGEQLVELAVGLLLEGVQLLFLFVGQFQRIPKERWQELAGLGRTTGGTTRATAAGRTAAESDL